MTPELPGKPFRVQAIGFGSTRHTFPRHAQKLTAMLRLEKPSGPSISSWALCAFWFSTLCVFHMVSRTTEESKCENSSKCSPLREPAYTSRVHRNKKTAYLKRGNLTTFFSCVTDGSQMTGVTAGLCRFFRCLLLPDC